MTNEYSPINIILADDHELFRDGFRVMFNKIPAIQLIGEASNGEELLKLCKMLKPDVVVTDIKMPVMDGIEATKKLKLDMPEVGVIALSMFDEESLIVDMLEAGARGYLLKNASKEEIIEAVNTVYKDEPYYCKSTSKKLTTMIAQSDFNPYQKIKPDLTDKEIAIVKLICEELSNKEMADKLGLSKRTVEGYREKILEKIGAKNTAGIVIYAMKNKLY